MKCARISIFSALALVSLGAARPAGALTPYRVADVDPTFRSASSSPEHFYPVGPRSVFLAKTPGLGLWSSDGTAAGTVRLLTSMAPIDAIAATGELLFVQTCASQVCRLYVTDGTVAGTRRLASGGGSSPGVVAGPRRIYFVRNTAPTGVELWTSDGTVAGTRLVKDLAPGPPSSNPHFLVWSGNRLWFFALDGLWTSNGTAAGTRQVVSTAPDEISGAYGLGGRLLFYAISPSSAEARIIASDGTAAGTRSLGVTLPTNQSLDPLVVAGTHAFFLNVKDDGSVFEREVWTTDGTAAGTRKVATFDFDDLEPTLFSVGHRVAFVAGDSEHGRELWSSDGTLAGTRGIEVCPGSCSGLERIGAVDGGRIWFAGETSAEGEELWTSDLTPAGTRRVKDLQPGQRSSYPDEFSAGGGKVYFTARSASFDEELWASDGTAAGTRRIAARPDFDTPLAFSFGTFVGARAFFVRGDVVHGQEPWISDGTPAGTRLVADLDPSQVSGSFPRLLGAAGGRGYFFAFSDRSDRQVELWSSDGTAAGTRMAVRFDDRQVASSSFVASAELGNRFALVISTGFDTAQIWISDGTLNGTFRLDGPDFAPTGKFRAVGGRLFFEARDADHDNELWTSDGTAAGTVRLSDFAAAEPFPEEGQHSSFRALGNRLAFLAEDAFNRLEPWVSDGTIAGTRHLADVYPALAASFFELSSEIVSAGGKYFYVSGEGSEAGTEPALWVTDLTVAGTRKVGALRDSGGEIAGEAGLFALGTKVVCFYASGFENGFYTSDGSSLDPGVLGVGLGFGPRGAEPRVWNGRLVYLGSDDRLYSTDGTAAGTRTFAYPTGEPVTTPRAFAVLGNRLAFSAFEGTWDTDGTPQGTVRRVPPRSQTQGLDLLLAGQRIYFAGYDAATGTELWALRP